MALRRPAARGRGLPPLPLAITLVVVAAILLSPVYLVLRASEQGSGMWDLLSAERTLEAARRTVLLTVAVTATSVALAVPLAWLTVRTDLPWRGFWTVALALPLSVPSFIGGFIVISALGPGGMLQDLLEPFGVQTLPELRGFRGAWLTLSVFSYPYIYLTVRAALKRTDPALEEASRTLGKSALFTFWRVNLPQMRPGISAGAILVALYVVSEFGAVSMLHYDTLTPLVYIEYTTSFDRSSAAVIGLPLLLLWGLVVGADGLTRGRSRYHTTGSHRPASRLSLGRWRRVAVAWCALIVVVGVGTPLFVLTYWLWRGISEGESARLLTEGVVNSARVSAMAAIVTVAAAIPVATLAVRHPGRFTALLEKLSYAGQSLPGITIALSLVFFAAHYATPLYQSLGLLVFALAVRFVPEALGACRSALLQVNPHTEEVARGLGAGGTRTFLRVTAPQIAPGVITGGVLAFLTAIKELQITLLLSPIGFDTLTTEIWNATSEAFFTRAALPALVLVLLSACAVLLILHRERLDAR